MICSNGGHDLGVPPYTSARRYSSSGPQVSPRVSDNAANDSVRTRAPKRLVGCGSRFTVYGDACPQITLPLFTDAAQPLEEL